MQCPVCKADNAQGPNCRRCKADLTLLFRLEEQRTGMLADVRRYLREGRKAEAVRLAVRADALRSDSESRRLAAVASLVDRQFAQALRFGLQSRERRQLP